MHPIQKKTKNVRRMGKGFFVPIKPPKKQTTYRRMGKAKRAHQITQKNKQRTVGWAKRSVPIKPTLNNISTKDGYEKTFPPKMGTKKPLPILRSNKHFL